jgi:Ni,Fe-hydrogenase I small subunit
MYSIVRELSKKRKEFILTVEGGIKERSTYCSIEVKWYQKSKLIAIPQ